MERRSAMQQRHACRRFVIAFGLCLIGLLVVVGGAAAGGPASTSGVASGLSSRVAVNTMARLSATQNAIQIGTEGGPDYHFWDIGGENGAVVVALDRATLQPVAVRNYDTNDAGYAASFINSLPNTDLVLAAAQDFTFVRSGWSKVFAELGATPTSPASAGNWSVIGIPDAFSGGWSNSDGAVRGYFQHRCTGPYWFVTKARTWTVTQLEDSAIEPGTFRHAIDAAVPGDTIKFQPGLSGTISIGREYYITQDLTIDGPGAGRLRIDAGYRSRIFAIVGGNVSISGLTLAHGSISSTPFNPRAKGGAIQDQSNGALSVSGVTFSGDRAGANGGVGAGGAISASFGSLSVCASAFSGDSAGGNGGLGSLGGSGAGGAIYSNSTSVSVAGSMFLDDSAGGSFGSGNSGGSGHGGAIDAHLGSLSVSGSTFTGDGAGGAGGSGPSSGQGDGGAIFALGGSLSVSNSTLSANSAGAQSGIGPGSGQGFGGAIWTNDFTATLSSDTIASNTVGPAGGSAGAGIAGAQHVTVLGSIVSGNTGTSNCDGHAGSSSFSMEGPAGNRSCGFVLPSADPLLGALQNYGGTTWTQALPPNSPAVGVIPKADCPSADAGVDQRGYPRPGQGKTMCDVGAYETQDSGAATRTPGPRAPV
jgi:Interleukin-like EMT inducer